MIDIAERFWTKMLDAWASIRTTLATRAGMLLLFRDYRRAKSTVLQTPRRTYRRNDLTYRTESKPAVLFAHFSEIRALADRDKKALGFLPPAAYREAIEKQRLIAMLTETDANVSVVGFVLFSGVFPYARIQQVVVKPEHRRKRLASALINCLVAQLEARGYISISAAVASDLPTAQAFYEASGFLERRAKAGGQARNRTIILKARDLETENLFSVLETSASVSPNATDLGLRSRSAGPAPLYVIDLNVLFDVLRDRHRLRSAAAST